MNRVLKHLASGLFCLTIFLGGVAVAGSSGLLGQAEDDWANGRWAEGLVAAHQVCETLTPSEETRDDLARAAYLRARFLEKQGAWPQLTDACDEAIDKIAALPEPDAEDLESKGWAYYCKAVGLHHLQKFEESREAAEQAQQVAQRLLSGKEPAETVARLAAWSLVQEARSHWIEENNSEAQSLLDEAWDNYIYDMSFDPNFEGEILMRQAVLAARNKDLQEASKICRKLDRNTKVYEGLRAEAMVRVAGIAEVQNATGTAIRYYKRALKKYPSQQPWADTANKALDYYKDDEVEAIVVEDDRDMRTRVTENLLTELDEAGAYYKQTGEGTAELVNVGVQLYSVNAHHPEAYKRIRKKCYAAYANLGTPDARAAYHETLDKVGDDVPREWMLLEHLHAWVRGLIYSRQGEQVDISKALAAADEAVELAEEASNLARAHKYRCTILFKDDRVDEGYEGVARLEKEVQEPAAFERAALQIADNIRIEKPGVAIDVLTKVIESGTVPIYKQEALLFRAMAEGYLGNKTTQRALLEEAVAMGNLGQNGLVLCQCMMHLARTVYYEDADKTRALALYDEIADSDGKIDCSNFRHTRRVEFKY